MTIKTKIDSGHRSNATLDVGYLIVRARNSLSIWYIAGGAGLGGWERHGQSLCAGQGADFEVELLFILLSPHRGHGANFRGDFLTF